VGNLPLLLLGAGAVYFITKKPAIIKTKKEISIEKESEVQGNHIGSKDIGYKIDNSTLTVYDRQKALDYAYQTGVKYTYKGQNYVSNILIGSQIDTLNKLTTESDIRFIFDLLIYGFSGMSHTINNPNYDKMYLIPLLEQFHIDLINLGSGNEEFLKSLKIKLL
jgi:hypothetical protein